MGFPGLPSDHVWYSLGRWGWANVDWCEATVMGYITEPANTWSNLAYIAVGAFLLQRRGQHDEHRLVNFMPWAIIIVGLLSGFYHATNAWVTQIGDFLGMYLVAGIPFLVNLQRLGYKQAGSYAAYGIVNLIGISMTIIGYYIGFPIQYLFAIFMFITIAMELMLMKNSPADGYKNFVKTLACFGIAATFSALDITRIMCDPHNHVIQGHALWHCFGSLGTFFAYGYCKDALRPGVKVGLAFSK